MVVLFTCKNEDDPIKNEGTRICLFVCLRLYVPVNNFFSHFGMASWVKPVLSNGDEVSCSKTQFRAPGEDRTRDLAIKRPTLFKLMYQCSLKALQC